MAKILLVEDDMAQVMMIRDMLESGQHQVAEAGNGVAAMQFLGIEPSDKVKQQLGGMDWAPVKNEWSADPIQRVMPDLVLSDCMMPTMDGLTLVTEMSQNEKVKSMKVVVLTTKITMEEPFKTLPNVISFVLKPADPDTLLDAVAKALAKP